MTPGEIIALISVIFTIISSTFGAALLIINRIEGIDKRVVALEVWRTMVSGNVVLSPGMMGGKRDHGEL